MIFDACRSITWASGRRLGPGYLEIFGPQMVLAYRLDANSQGPKNSSFPGPKPTPTCTLNGSENIKNIMHVAVKIIGA